MKEGGTFFVFFAVAGYFLLALGQKQPTQYSSLADLDKIFDRTSVEAPPDVVDDELEPISPQLRTIPLVDGFEFSRGSVEYSPSKYSQTERKTPLLYYGAAAKSDNVEEYLPLRSSVEAVPYRIGNEVSDDKYRVVCYYSSWNVQRETPVPFDLTRTDLDLRGCTHLIYAFAHVDEDTFKIKSANPDVDVVRGHYLAATRLKSTHKRLRVMIGVGGANAGAKVFSEMAASAENRRAFIDSAMEFIKTYRFDGMDVNWEFPGSSDRGGKEDDK